jgi:hypothetical protein
MANLLEDPNCEIAEQSMSEFQTPVYADDIAAIVNNEIMRMTKLMQEMSYFIPEIQKISRSQADFQKKIRKCQEFVLNAYYMSSIKSVQIFCRKEN